MVTSSTGNHGVATAYSASLHHLPARIYLPENPNPAKRARIAEFAVEIVEAGKFLEETRKHAAQFARESGWYDIVDGIDPDMLPGTATIACEILDQLESVDVIFVPVGDSTLIRGVAFAAKQLRPEVKIIGVQAELAPAYALSFAKGHAISTDSSDTIADGLAVRDALEENVRQMAGLVDEFVLVSEEEMLGAMRHLLNEEEVVAEPAGAATTAAFLKSAAAYANKTAVLLVTGANVSEEIRRSRPAKALSHFLPAAIATGKRPEPIPCDFNFSSDVHVPLALLNSSTLKLFFYLIHPAVRPRGRFFLLVHVHLEALLVALVFPVGNAVAHVVQERASP